MKTVIRNLMTCTVLLGVPAPLAGQSTLLRLIPAEGLVSRYRVESVQSQPMGGPVTATFFRTDTVVESRADGVVLAAVVDSAWTEDGSDWPGRNYSFEVDSRGRFIGLTDTNDLPQGLIVGAETLLKMTSVELPEGEVGPGDSWTGSWNWSTEAAGDMGMMTLTMAADLTYTLTSVDGDLAEIAFAGTVTMGMGASGMMVQGSGDLTGSAVFDAGMGRVRSYENEMSVALELGGMSADMDSTTSVTLIP